MSPKVNSVAQKGIFLAQPVKGLVVNDLYISHSSNLWTPTKAEQTPSFASQPSPFLASPPLPPSYPRFLPWAVKCVLHREPELSAFSPPALAASVLDRIALTLLFAGTTLTSPPSATSSLGSATWGVRRLAASNFTCLLKSCGCRLILWRGRKIHSQVDHRWLRIHGVCHDRRRERVREMPLDRGTCLLECLRRTWWRGIPWFSGMYSMGWRRGLWRRC